MATSQNIQSAWMLQINVISRRKYLSVVSISITIQVFNHTPQDEQGENKSDRGSG
jgi:hypothetical protein